MDAMFDGLHWQAKSVGPQPTADAAGAIHVAYLSHQIHDPRHLFQPAKHTAQVGTLAAMAAH